MHTHMHTRGRMDARHPRGLSGGKRSSRRLQKPHDPHFRQDENSRASEQTNELPALQSSVSINHRGPCRRTQRLPAA